MEPLRAQFASFSDRLVDGLPSEALNCLRIAFRLPGATSIQHFFERMNSKGYFTGPTRQRTSHISRMFSRKTIIACLW